MDARELRIGNYISRNDIGNGMPREETILELGERAVTSGPFKVICSYDDIQPIPLTEEWLLKFGFEHVNQKGYNHFEKNGIWIYLLTDKTFELELETLHERHNLCRQWNYVHQLQNLHFAITGEELKSSTPPLTQKPQEQ